MRPRHTHKQVQSDGLIEINERILFGKSIHELTRISARSYGHPQMGTEGRDTHKKCRSDTVCH